MSVSTKLYFNNSNKPFLCERNKEKVLFFYESNLVKKKCSFSSEEKEPKSRWDTCGCVPDPATL